MTAEENSLSSSLTMCDPLQLWSHYFQNSFSCLKSFSPNICLLTVVTTVNTLSTNGPPGAEFEDKLNSNQKAI